jgi:hypothetical protein
VTFTEFQSTIATGTPPDIAPLLLALWYDARGDWDRAHSIAQEVEDEHGSLVHAYLHRKEGDLPNADYWYRRARRQVAIDSVQSEWARIVTELLT